MVQLDVQIEELKCSQLIQLFGLVLSPVLNHCALNVQALQLHPGVCNVVPLGNLQLLWLLGFMFKSLL